MRKIATGHRWALPKKSTKEDDWNQVQQILNGETECWDMLYNTAYHTVLRCVIATDCQKRFEHHEYRDIVDEAFYLCYAQLERYCGWSKFSGWVSGYAKNITRNRHSRDHTRQKYTYAQGQRNRWRMENCDPLSILIRQERNACLWRAFYEMSSVDQIILSERILNRETFAAIGKELHLTRKEVLRRYGAAANRLRGNFVRYYCGCDANTAAPAWRIE